MKRVLSLLLSAVMLAGAAVATYAAPPAISNSSDAKMYVDFEDGQNSIWTQGFSIEGEDREYQLRANPKKIYTVTNKKEANNKYIEFRRTGVTGDADGYFDIYYYEPSDANRKAPWTVENKRDQYNPVYDHAFILS